MYIQYVGFDVTAGSRAYAFRVIATPAATREFTVKIQSQAFWRPPLKFQDGPGICFARLKQELEAETQESRAEASLAIREQDVQEYLQRHYLTKRR